MSRISWVLCCAMVVLLVLVDPARLSAQEPTVEPSEPLEPGIEERIEAVLDRPLKAPLDFPELPLVEITDTLQDEYDVPIVFDLSALDEVAVSPETEITVDLRNISLRSALNSCVAARSFVSQGTSKPTPLAHQGDLAGVRAAVSALPPMI